MSSSTTAALPSYPGTLQSMHSHPARKHLAGTALTKAKLKEPVIHSEPMPTPRDMVVLKPVLRKRSFVNDVHVSKRQRSAVNLRPVQKKKSFVHDVHVAKRKSFVNDVTPEEDFVYLTTGNNTTLNRFSDLTMSTKRASYNTTTKAELRESNHQLFEMLQDVQSELATHRTLLQDIQSRLSFLENDAPTMVGTCEPDMLSPVEEKIAAPTRAAPPPPRRPSSLIPPGLERQSWWQACQNFAENCDTPFNAQEFLGKSSALDDFEFHFGGLPTDGGARPESTPILDLDELPALSPSSSHLPEIAELTLDDSPSPRISTSTISSASPSVFSLEPAPRTSNLTALDADEIDQIIEQIVEFKKPATLPPLLLHPPPTSRASMLSVDDGITALPDLPPVELVDSATERKRRALGMKSISSKWASLKGRGTETSYYRNGIFDFSTR